MIFNRVSDDVKNIILALRSSPEPQLNNFARLLDSVQIKKQIAKNNSVVFWIGREIFSDKEVYPSFS